MNVRGDFQIRGWNCTYARFSSSELTEITGVPGQIQRLWRSRGLLPGTKSPKPSFSSRDVAEIMVRYDLSKLGVPPGASFHLGRRAACMILWFAFLNSDGACEVHGTRDATDDFLEEFNRDESLAGHLCGEPNVMRYICKSAEVAPVFVSDLNDIYDYEGARSGSFVDLERTAADLTSQSNRPLIRIDLGDGDYDRIVRRLTGQRIPHLRLV